MPNRDFVHPELNEEIQSISGHFAFQEEKRLKYNEKEILYITGYSVTDSSCCGVGGCIFSLVAGFITNWHYRTNDDGRPVTEVEAIDDETIRKEITSLIKGKEICTQVNFI